MFHIGWGGEQTTIYKGVETFPQQTRFKALSGSPKGKVQRGQCLLAVDLGHYKWYQSQSPDDVSAFSLFLEGGQTRGGVPVRMLAPKGGWIWRRSHIDWIKKRVPARTLGPEGGWIVMSHISWGGEQTTITTIYKGVETFPQQTRFKALRGSPRGKAQRGHERESPKRTISASGGSESLHNYSSKTLSKCGGIPKHSHEYHQQP